MAARDLAFALKRPFAEQVAFFRGKLGNLVPTATWRDIQRSAHDTAFMVAGAAKADLLADLAAAVDKAIADGESIQKFRARFAEIVEKHGWHGWTGEETKAGRAWRTRVIYRTNMATSYAAGRLAQLKSYPLWVYKHSGAEHPRLQHLAWNGLTLPADHEFWKTHYPPNGWGCGCRVVGARSADGAARLGGDPRYNAPPEGWNVRDSKGLLPGIGEGWDYQPGATSPMVETLGRKAAALPARIAQAFEAHVLRYVHPSQIARFSEAKSRERLKALREYLGDSFDRIRSLVQDIDDKRLTLADKIAIHAYTWSYWYRDINRAIRLKSKTSAQRHMRRHEAMITALDAALEKLPAYRGVVMRGVRVPTEADFNRWASLKEGEVIATTQYLSTSATGRAFKSSVNLKIHTISGRDIAQFSYYRDEGEVLIPRGRQFRVMNVRAEREKVYIELKELKPSEYKDLLPRAYMRASDGKLLFG